MKTLCVWTLDDMEGIYDTSCDNRHEFIVGDIALNGYKFCPYCGDKIHEMIPEEHWGGEG